MQDSHLCCLPYFFLDPAVAPHFFISRIATALDLQLHLHTTFFVTPQLRIS